MTADLTRWNRAGLERFTYVNANAVTLLERLRTGLDAQWPNGVYADQAQDTPQSRYEATPHEWGWQLSRVLARSAHILLGYVDAYANEGFLPTATQWENVRRLVAMLGYRPAPPASASTPLAILVKAGLRGTIDAGLAVRSAPADGSPPVTFETLAPLDADAALNALHLEGYGVNPHSLGGQLTLTLESVPKSLRSGEPIVLEDLDASGPAALEAHLVTGIQGSTLTLAEPVGGDFVTGRTVVHAVPADRLRPIGPVQGGTATLPATLQLAPGQAAPSPGEVVIVSDTQSTVYRRVGGQRGNRLILDQAVGPMDLADAAISRPIELAIQGFAPGRATKAGEGLVLLKVAGDWSRLRGATVAVTAPGQVTAYGVIAADYTPPGATPRAQTTAPLAVPGFTVLSVEVGPTQATPRNVQKLLVPPPTPGPWRLDPFLARQADVDAAGAPVPGRGKLPRAMTISRPKHTGPGDLVVVVRRGQSAWGSVAGVDPQDDATAVLRCAEPLRERGGGAFYLADTAVYAGFGARLRPAGWQENDTPVDGTQVVLDAGAPGLKPGRALILGRLDAPDRAVATSVFSLAAGSARLTLADPLPSGSTVGNVEIAANVVLAGHGVRRGALTLGSGDAAQTRQSFAVNVPDVSWIADTTMPNGVRADLDVRVGGERWTQVASLDAAGQTDDAFEVHVREDGGLQVVFGDGQSGRRLPSGINNVVAGYRAGVGLAGNAPAASLTALVAPHPLVGAVRQPLPASGGNELESSDSMATSAPATVLTLGRAVSLEDFTSLAGSQSSVWQALAIRAAEAGTGESVTVAIVPAGGSTLTSTLRATIEQFLTLRALPGVTVTAQSYTPVRLSMLVTVTVDPQHFEPPAVAEAVRAALLSAFTLPARKLAQEVHRSEVFRIVEAVPGVLRSQCWIAAGTDTPNPDARVQRLAAQPSDVLTLEPDGSTLLVTAEALL